MRRTCTLTLLAVAPSLTVLITGCWLFPQSAYIGVKVDESTATNRSSVLITQVDANTLASAADLQPNDVIVSFNRKSVSNMVGLQQAFAEIAIGQTFPLKVFRPSAKNIIAVSITLNADANDIPTSLGVHVRDSTTPAGSLIVSVDYGSVAETAGLLAGDMITKFNGTVAANVAQLRKAMASVTENSTVIVNFRRGAAASDDAASVTIKYSVISRIPLLGIAGQDLSAELADKMGYPALGGAKIASSVIDGPAFTGDLMPLDVIFLYGDYKIQKASHLTAAVRAMGPWNPVTVGYARGGDVLTTTVQPSLFAPQGDSTLNVGLSLEEVDNIGGTGVQIVGLVSGSAATEAQLLLDDIITYVQGNQIFLVQDFYRQLDAAYKIRPVIYFATLTTLRDGVTVTRLLRIRASTTDPNS